ncbi:MAG: DUF1735 domain-containing protein [Alistipes sp.]|nr:DUF1735 domain-containing protein [Alistipes senegalensis]MCM1250534.1 DUF1735 domain-containing protein [Alistipes sp.]
MKYTIKIGLCAAVFALAGAACDDSEYDLQTLVPDRYHSVVNVQDDTNGQMRIYDTGLDQVREFTVLRGGSDPSKRIDARAVPMTEEELASYGADYVLLPADCYALDGGIEMPAGKDSQTIRVSFAAAQITKIREMNAALEAPKSYCLALELESDNALVFDGKSVIVRRLDVMLPQIGFAEAGEQQKKLYDAKQDVNFDFAVVRGESDLEQPIASRLVPMTEEELAAVNPDYMVIPAAHYTLSASDILIPAGETELPLSVGFSGEQISAIRTLAEAQRKQACLALRIASDNVATSEAKGELLYVMDVTQPVLRFELVSGAEPHPFRPWWWDNRHDDGSWNLTYPDYMTPCTDCWGGGVTFRLKMPEGIRNTWTIKCKFANDPSLVEAYNAIEEVMGPDTYGGIQNWRKRATDYAALPAAADLAFFDADGNPAAEITMEPGTDEVLVTYKRNTSSFDGAGLYLCPIVATTDLFPVDGEQYVLFQDEIGLSDKTLWEPCEAGEGTLSVLYDGNRWGGAWQTKWNPGYCDKTYGQYFQINIASYQPSHAIRFALWANGDNEWHWNEATAPREMKVFITSDAVPAPTGDLTADRAVYDALTWEEAAHVWCQAYSGQGWFSPAIELNGRKANAIRICAYSKAGDSANYKTNSGPFEGDFNREPWNDRVQTVCNDRTWWNGWEDTYGNNITITEFRMWGN